MPKRKKKRRLALLLKTIFRRENMALVFMLVPVIISFCTFNTEIKKKLLFIRWSEYAEFSISPSFVSTIAAISLYLSLVIRGRMKLFTDVYETIMICLNIMFCASFLEVFIPKEPWPIPIINVSSQSFLIAAIVFSWVGMRAISGFIWIFLFLLAVIRIAGLNVAMGQLGWIYVLSAFVSIGLQLKSSAALLSSLAVDFRGAASHIAEDTSAAASLAAGKSPVARRRP